MLTRMTRLTALLAIAVATLLTGPVSSALAQTIGQQVRSADLATLQQIGVPGVWRQTRGAGVTVAVLDTGVRPNAPDLTGQVTVGPDYAAGANPPGYQPPHLHGTYIGSIIAGHGSGPGRAQGMIGVAPAARLLSVRVILDDTEPGFAVYNANASYAGAVAAGIMYAVRHGAQVINMSLGGPQATRSMRLALAYAVSHDVVVVAAAGNSGSAARRFTPYSYPAAFPGVIAVAAVGRGGHRASFSDRNSSVVVSAPGVGVVGAGPGSSYLVGSGTSPASAFVAGIAALIRSRYPALTPVQVMQALVSSAGSQYRPGTGFGEVNAVAALSAAARLARPPASRAGASAAARFGPAQAGPIVVVPVNGALVASLTALGAAAAAGFAGCCAWFLIGLRRRRQALAGPPSREPQTATEPQTTTAPAAVPDENGQQAR